MAIKTFTTGEVLTASDTNTYLANSGLVFVKSESATSGTSLVVSDAFSATYDNYRIVLSGIATTSAVALTMKMGAAASGHYNNVVRVDNVTFAVNGAGSTNAAAWSPIGIGTTTAGTSMVMDICSPFLTTNTTFTGNYTDNRTAIALPCGMSGFLSDSTSYTAFTIAGGTFTSITATVYGYRKS
jgi:hypothetical protein